MNRLKTFFISLTLLSLSVFGFAGSALAYDAISEQCKDANATSSAVCQASNKDPILGKNGIIYKVAMFISLLAGAVGVIMIIYAGFTMVTASGDTGKIAKARQTIVYVVVGLIVIVASAQIVAIVVSRFA